MSSNENIDKMPKKSPLSFQIDLKKFEKATDEEKKQQDVMSESVSFFKDGMRKLLKNPLAVGSIIVLILIIGSIIIVPHVVPYGYSEIITVDGKRDKTSANMAPFEWSETEQEYAAPCPGCRFWLCPELFAASASRHHLSSPTSDFKHVSLRIPCDNTSIFSLSSAITLWYLFRYFASRTSSLSVFSQCFRYALKASIVQRMSAICLISMATSISEVVNADFRFIENWRGNPCIHTGEVAPPPYQVD